MSFALWCLSQTFNNPQCWPFSFFLMAYVAFRILNIISRTHLLFYFIFVCSVWILLCPSWAKILRPKWWPMIGPTLACQATGFSCALGPWIIIRYKWKCNPMKPSTAVEFELLHLKKEIM